jgi:ketosteroid isomerase-like protein
MTEAADNLAKARKYLAAIESGATGEALASFFTPDVVQEELPNRLVPNGAHRDLAAILEGAVRGQKVLTSQKFTVLRETGSGDHVALEVEWVGTLAVPIGTLQPGGQMRARFAVFLDFRDGRIAAQRNYDCFDPW